MSLFDLLVNPGAAVGCAVGVLAAGALHWAFPEHDLAFAQALLIALGCIVGMVYEHDPFSGKPKK